MAIQMRRGLNADLDKSRLVAGEFAVSLDEEKVCVARGNGNVVDLATKTDLDNLIAYMGTVRVEDESLIFAPSESV